MTKIEKIVIAVGVVVVVFGIFAAVDLYDREKKCDEVGGVMIRILGGYRCMKELK